MAQRCRTRREAGDIRAENSGFARRGCRSWSFADHRAVAVLRRYFRAAISLGQVPSGLGLTPSRLDAGRLSYTRAHSFEGAVVFVIDVGAAVGRLPDLERRALLLTECCGYTYVEAAQVLGCCWNSVYQWRRSAIEGLALELDRRGLLCSR